MIKEKPLPVEHSVTKAHIVRIIVKSTKRDIKHYDDWVE